MDKRKYNLVKMEKKLKKYLDTDRFTHTQGVMYTCACLAMVYGVDMQSALTAGLLHDCAKSIPNDKKLRICAKKHISISRFEKANPFLLHAKLGAYLASKKYRVSDERILTAITYHTTGRPMMHMLEKIVFAADYIEPHRDKAPHLAKIRKMAFSDLDECIYLILSDTLQYLNSGPGEIDKTTEDAYIYYKEIHQKKQEEKQ